MKKYIILFGVVLLILGGTLLIKKWRSDEVKFRSSQALPEAAVTPEPVTPYTLVEVAKHSTEDSCWVVINGSVYNMTSFISSHPGGKAILKGCGKDASALFNSVQSHTAAIKDFLKTFKIGILDQQK